LLVVLVPEASGSVNALIKWTTL